MITKHKSPFYTRYITCSFQFQSNPHEVHPMLEMTAEMTADYIMIIRLVEMTAEMTAGYCDILGQDEGSEFWLWEAMFNISLFSNEIH